MDLINQLLRHSPTNIYDVQEEQDMFIRIRTQEDWNKVLKYLYVRFKVYNKIQNYQFHFHKEHSCIYVSKKGRRAYITFGSCDYYESIYEDIVIVEVNQLKEWGTNCIEGKLFNTYYY